jgi:hypothetical protein
MSKKQKAAFARRMAKARKARNLKPSKGTSRALVVTKGGHAKLLQKGTKVFVKRGKRPTKVKKLMRMKKAERKAFSSGAVVKLPKKFQSVSGFATRINKQRKVYRRKHKRNPQFDMKKWAMLAAAFIAGSAGLGFLVKKGMPMIQSKLAFLASPMIDKWGRPVVIAGLAFGASKLAEKKLEKPVAKAIMYGGFAVAAFHVIQNFYDLKQLPLIGKFANSDFSGLAGVEYMHGVSAIEYDALSGIQPDLGAIEPVVEGIGEGDDYIF